MYEDLIILKYDEEADCTLHLLLEWHVLSRMLVEDSARVFLVQDSAPTNGIQKYALILLLGKAQYVQTII